MDEKIRKEITLYIENACEVLQVAQLNLNNGFYASAINRAYYAIFYAANALLCTKGLSRNKHSAVVSAFRQHFVKTGFFDIELSRIYGRVMGNRHSSDYDLSPSITPQDAEQDLADATRFVNDVAARLHKDGWL